MNPILSICIPTYNRGEYLKKGLESMVSDATFINSNEIEIVVSDNASTDCTQVICQHLAKQFPGKFIYHRQSVNLGYSANVATLTKLAHGEFFKFQNDHFMVLPGVLSKIVGFVRENIGDRPILCFGNAFIPYHGVGILKFNTGDEFLEYVSYWTAWLGCYGFWREDAIIADNIGKEYAGTMIPQTAVLWELFKRRKRGCLYNYKIYSNENDPPSKGGYNVAEVFSQNYLGILRKYVDDCRITKQAFEKEKKRLFKGHIYGMYFDFNHRRSYAKGKYFYFTRDYHGNWYYWVGFMVWPVYRVISILPLTLKNSLLMLYSSWRKLMRRA